jgi:hypothetical protein
MAERKRDAEAPDLGELAKELQRQLGEVGKQFKEAFEKVAEDTQYTVDREMARFLAKHPELYAEVKKTLRQIKKTADKAADALGIE